MCIFPFKIFYVQNFYNTQSLYFHIQTSAIKRKYPTLTVRIFLVSARTHSISRYIHNQTLCIHKRNVPRFLQHGTYHVVVRGGSHFCQSPKGGGQKKIPKFPSPPPLVYEVKLKPVYGYLLMIFLEVRGRLYKG